MIYVDLDDTLCDFAGAMAVELNKIYLNDPNIDIKISYMTGKDVRENWHAVRQDCSKVYSREFFANLSITPWAPELIKSLPWMNTTILTYVPGNDQEIIRGKLDWIKKHMRPNTPVIFAPMGLPDGKNTFYKYHHDVLIDDMDKEVERWNGESFLIPRDFDKVIPALTEGKMF